jgi:hypothetical protein
VNDVGACTSVDPDLAAADDPPNFDEHAERVSDPV